MQTFIGLEAAASEYHKLKLDLANFANYLLHRLDELELKFVLFRGRGLQSNESLQT